MNAGYPYFMNDINHVHDMLNVLIKNVCNEWQILCKKWMTNFVQIYNLVVMVVSLAKCRIRTNQNILAVTKTERASVKDGTYRSFKFHFLCHHHCHHHIIWTILWKLLFEFVLRCAEKMFNFARSFKRFD